VSGNSTYVPVIYSWSPIIKSLKVLLNEPNFLPNIFSLLHQTKTSLKMDDLLVISSITGNEQIVGVIVNRPDYFNLLLEIATKDIPGVMSLKQRNNF